MEAAKAIYFDLKLSRGAYLVRIRKPKLWLGEFGGVVP